ncbi:MAG: MmgE/PrpD family protein, partial [Acidimicrobiia bacterium]|nr:MmgE/PrpD family protein [Acidimicrobiia bacterium]
GETFETMNICLKRFACHITAHTPVQAVLDLKDEYGFDGDDVDSVTVWGSPKMVTHHDITEPADIQLGQYSTPFCVAVAMYRDPLDPRSFMEDSLNDEAIRDLCRRVRIELRTDAAEDPKPWACAVQVKLKDGRTAETAVESFPGMPHDPLGRDELAARFMSLTTDMDPRWRIRVSDALFDLENLEGVADLLRDPN